MTSKVLGVLLVVLCMAVLMGFFWGEKAAGVIQEGRVLSFLAPTVQMLWPAGDLYRSLDESRLVLVPGREATMSVVHKYIGRHVVRLALDSRSTDCRDEWFDLQLELEVRQGGNLLVKQAVDLREKAGNCYWSAEETGVILFWYTVPGEIPVREDTNWRVSVLQAGRAEGGVANVSIGKVQEY